MRVHSLGVQKCPKLEKECVFQVGDGHKFWKKMAENPRKNMQKLYLVSLFMPGKSV